MSNKSFFSTNFKYLLIGFLLLTAILVMVRKKEYLLSQISPETTQPKTLYSLPQTRSYEKSISLPKAKVAGGIAVERAIQERRSRREFSKEPVTLAELSQLLWSAQGITEPETGHRAAPSARGAYPFTVFVVVRNVNGLAPGLYEYLPNEHALGDMKVATAGELLNSAGVQPGAQNAPVVFALSASYGKAEKTLGESAVSSSLLEAGHIGQNMYLQTESLGMGMVVMGGFDAQKVGTALTLDPAETVVYLMPFGNRAPAKTAETVLGTTTDGSTYFTAEELAQYDGKEGRKAYFAYEGKVYDATMSDKWKLGEHFGLSAGKDLTGLLGEAPHGAEVLTDFPLIGIFGEPPVSAEPVASEPADNTQMYYVAGGAALLLLVVGLFMGSKRKSGKK